MLRGFTVSGSRRVTVSCRPRRIWALAWPIILGWFLGQQNSRVTLAILVLTNGVNIALDLLFVVGLGMTSDGGAWATVIAGYAAWSGASGNARGPGVGSF